MQTKTGSKHISPERLVREFRKALDTPALISLLAGDKELLEAVDRVLNPATDEDAGFLEELHRVCREENISVLDLKHGLASAAAALGLPVKGEDQSEDLYDILDLPFDAPDSAIRKAYRSKALELHPDTNPGADPALFARLAEAYRVLGNPELRERYDAREQERHYWVEKSTAFRKETERKESLRRRQRRRVAFQLAAVLGFLLITILFVDYFFKEQALREGRPVREASTEAPPQPVASGAKAAEARKTELHAEPARDTLKKIEDFMASYCRAYGDLSYERFMEHFAPDAVQNEWTVKELQPTYRSMFDTLQALFCDIEVKHYAILDNRCEVSGDYFLRWRFNGADWEERRGPIFMALVLVEDTFLVERMVYR